MKTTVNYARVKAAVARLTGQRTFNQQADDGKPKIPVDSALRKPLRSGTKSCCGFEHPHFLNNCGNR